MKKMFTKVLAVVLCTVMALGAAPLGGLVGLDLPSLFDFKAEAASFLPRLTEPTYDTYYKPQSSYNPFKVNYDAYGGNCTWYAWGRAYEITGIYPKLGTGNAGTWWSYNKNGGYYPYGSTPKLGAVACWSNSGAGHVAVVEQINGDGTIVISESGWSSCYFRTVTIPASGSRSDLTFQGFIYLGDYELYTSIPNPVTNLSSNKAVYNSSESITFTWDAVNYATQYWVYLWKDGTQLYAHNCGTNTSFTQSASSPGKYTLYIRPGNSIGFNEGSNSCTFIVTDDIPNPVTNISSEKQVYNSSESVNFSWEPAYGTETYWVYLWKDGTQLYAHNCGNKTSFTQAPSSSGKYTLIIRPQNSNGFNDGSKSYSYIVTNDVPETVENLNSEKSVYTTGETISFTWDSAYGADAYWVYLWKDGAELYSYNCGNKTSFTQAPSSEGNYTFIVRAGNVNGFDSNGARYYYTVSDGFEVTYNSNGGSNPPTAQTKTYGTDLKLGTTIPTKANYNFIGWNTKADGTGTTYQPGDTYTKNADLTLYAMWELVHCHSYTSSVTKQPTCTEKGIRKYTCSSCADTYTEDITALDHTGGSWVITKQPSCTEEGTKVKTCTKCNTVLSTETIAKSEHDAGNWQIVTMPTANSEGLKVKKCKSCGMEMIKEIIPMIELVVTISSPSTKTVNYGDTLVLQLEDVELPEGWRVEWSIIGNAATYTVSENGKECRVTSTASGNVTVTATLIDENGESVIDNIGNEIFDDINLKSNANFWQKIVSFFKNLFRINRIIY